MGNERLLRQSEIHAMVAEQLGMSSAEVDIDDNLVELGMHSLGMIKLAAAWRRAGHDVNFGDLALDPTVRRWGELLAERSTATPPPAEPEARHTARPAPSQTLVADDTFGLATMQHAYWVGRSDEQALGGVAAHLYAEFDGQGVEPERLSRAVDALVRRHPMLRCQFLDHGRQQVLDRAKLPVFRQVDLKSLSETEVADRLAEMRHTMTHQRMPAADGKVFDVVLTELPGGRTRLHVDVDMLAADALSYRLLMADLAEFYTDGDGSIDALDYTYREYLAEPSRTRPAERERAWWHTKLPELPDPPRLPLVPEADRPDPHLTVRYDHWIDAASKERLIDRSRRAGITPATVLAAVFAEVVGRWSSEQRFLLNLPLFNREPTHPDVERVVGDFSNSVMLAMQCSNDASILDRTRDLQGRLHDGVSHAAYPGLDVLRDLGRYRGEPLLAPVVYTSGLNLGELFRDEVRDTFGEPVWIVSQGPQVVLDAQVVELRGGLLLNWDVREHAFPARLMAEMFGRHREIIEELLSDDADWTRPLGSQLPSAQQEVRRRLNGGTAPRSGRCLHDEFFTAALDTPERTALLWGEGQSLDYAALRDRTLRVAAALRDRGIGPGQAVSIQLPKGVDQVIAAIGVLAAGATYVPIGYDQPPARRDRIQQIGEVVLGIVPSAAADDRSAPSVPVLSLDAAAAFPEPLSAPVPVDDDTIAYVLFTSGSTGEPKGVEVPHSAAVNTIERCIEMFDVTHDDRSLALSPLEFDLSVQDVFGLLSVGGSVVVADEATRRDGHRAAELVRRHRVTQLYCVPALLDMILSAAAADGLGDQLRTVLVGGDWVGVDLPRRLRELVPGCRFAGLGGATETAIHHTVCEVTGPLPEDCTAVPFGVPLDNVRCRVVNERGLDCPDWVAGELWIGGSGLARGYRGDPDRTAERFVDHAGERWYRTGDSARYRPDGTVEFLGRRDLQVKIRGYRIELGEVEAALRSLPGVQRAVVEAVGTHTRALAAAVVGDPTLDPDQLRTEVGTLLAPYMVPERIELLDALPLTGSGKIDRRTLRARLAAGGEERQYTPPGDDLEDALARIIADVLSTERIGVESDFFTLGGDSVLATVAVARIREWLDTSDVSVADLYAGRNVRGLAVRLADRQRTPGRLEKVATLYLDLLADDGTSAGRDHG
ncbi:amino acid adenylation domain-containing protein [Streptomyces sp. NPDC056500]|uniref:non-ribosomal peptide synthetase n=1 Tax=Streptomyces sp. NPDC056500 TaxID=3345840 RepID=UPI003676620F